MKHVEIPIDVEQNVKIHVVSTQGTRMTIEILPGGTCHCGKVMAQSYDSLFTNCEIGLLLEMLNEDSGW